MTTANRAHGPAINGISQQRPWGVGSGCVGAMKVPIMMAVQQPCGAAEGMEGQGRTRKRSECPTHENEWETRVPVRRAAAVGSRGAARRRLHRCAVQVRRRHGMGGIARFVAWIGSGVIPTIVSAGTAAKPAWGSTACSVRRRRPTGRGWRKLRNSVTLAHRHLHDRDPNDSGFAPGRLERAEVRITARRNSRPFGRLIAFRSSALRLASRSRRLTAP